MWEIPEATVLGKLRFGTGPIQVVTFDPETKRLLAIEKAGVVHVHDLATRREIWTRELGDGAVNGARISPDGTRIACARRDGTVEVLDAATGVSVARLDAGLGETQRVAFGPDSTTLASTHPDGKIGLWTLDGPRSIEKLEVPWEVFSVAFVRGTSLFAVGGWNGMLEVWDTATREPVATLAGHAQVVTSISSSPDGSLIVSGSFDGTVRLWDARTGEALRTFEPGGGIVHNVTIRADGNSIACACADGTFRVWDLRWCDRHIAGNREHQRARHAAQGQR
jgi:tricorn protease-like protein